MTKSEENVELGRRQEGIEGDRYDRIQERNREERERAKSGTEPQFQVEQGWREPVVLGDRYEPPAPSVRYQPTVTSATIGKYEPTASSDNSRRPQRRGRGRGKGKAKTRACESSANGEEKEEKRRRKRERSERRKGFARKLSERGANLPPHARESAPLELRNIPLTLPATIPLASQIPLPPSRADTPRTLLDVYQQRNKLDSIRNSLQVEYGDGYLSRMLVMRGGDEEEVVGRLITGDIPKAMRGADTMMPLDEHGRFSLEDRRRVD